MAGKGTSGAAAVLCAAFAAFGAACGSGAGGGASTDGSGVSRETMVRFDRTLIALNDAASQVVGCGSACPQPLLDGLADDAGVAVAQTAALARKLPAGCPRNGMLRLEVAVRTYRAWARKLAAGATESEARPLLEHGDDDVFAAFETWQQCGYVTHGVDFALETALVTKRLGTLLRSIHCRTAACFRVAGRNVVEAAAAGARRLKALLPSLYTPCMRQVADTRLHYVQSFEGIGRAIAAHDQTAILAAVHNATRLRLRAERQAVGCPG